MRFFSVLFVLYITSILALSGAARAQCPVGEWTVGEPPVVWGAWEQVIYAEGLFVAVGSAGTQRIMTSPDGINWTPRAAPQNSWRWLAYGNGMFVAVAWSGAQRILTSPDGITWTPRTAPAQNGWHSVTFGNGRFVAVANSGTQRVMTSTDGINWTLANASATSEWSTVGYGGGMFVALAWQGSTRAMSSLDGINWTSRSIPAGGWIDVTYGRDQFVAVSWTGTHVATSPDGMTWTARTPAHSMAWNGVTYANGHYIAVGGGGGPTGTSRMMVSADGITWENHNIPHQGTVLGAIAWGNDRLVLLGFDNYPRQVFVGDCPQRCYMPDGKRGTREWFTSTAKYRFCDGELWQDFSLDGAAGSCAIPGQMDWHEPEFAHTICDGADRQVLRHAYVDLGACTRKATIDFDPAAPLYKYCDGNQWRPMTCVAAEGSVECPFRFNTIYRGAMGVSMDWTHKWDEGVLAFNNKIYAVPKHATDMLVIDIDDTTASPYGTATRTAMGVTIPSGEWKWGGAVLGSNGKIYGIPSGVSDILVIDPFDTTGSPHGTATLTKLGESWSGGGRWGGGVRAGNDKIYAIPNATNRILVIDTSDTTAGPHGTATRVTLGASLAGSDKWCGGALAANGKIYAMPDVATDILVIDPHDTTASPHGTATRTTMGATIPVADGKWCSAVVGPNGKIYAFPFYAGMNQFLIIDPFDLTGGPHGTATLSNLGASISGGYKWVHGVKGPDGKLYGVPDNATNIIVIDTENLTAGPHGTASVLHSLPNGGWVSGVLAPNNHLYMTPSWGNQILVMDFAQSDCLSDAARTCAFLPDPCAEAPSPGDICLDGTVYAGVSPDGNAPMFTTRQDNQLSSPPYMNWGSYGTARGVTDGNTGAANTGILAGFGGSAHPVAHYCATLSAHGYDDWYLPARHELHRMMQNAAAIGNFIDAEFQWYYSSTEIGGNLAYINKPTLNINANTGKNDNFPRSRCVRKGG